MKRFAVLMSLLVMGALVVPTTDAQDRKRKPKVIQLEEIKIEGRVQKPNAFYILNRSNIGYRVMELKTSFVREVVRSVRREPF
ncbi:MAG: hypothetical protein OXT09_28340 [Myxococcales bacterium]|nr:hypothetical protein [Myxococcales bacterium]